MKFPYKHNGGATLIILVGILLTMGMSSCSKYVLFKKHDALTSSTNRKTENDTAKTQYEKPIAIDDKLIISIWDHDDISVGSIHSIYSLMEENGKWLAVDERGEIKLPQVGSVRVAGLTVREATLYLEKVYSKFIQSPVINLRIINSHVTVLGEVHKPGNYVFNSDNIKLVDLLGKAEGFTDFARTSKIKIIRGSEHPTETILDYTNVFSLTGPDAILHPGDVVYVPPTNAKSSDRFTSKFIPVASLISAIVLIFTVANK